MRLEDVTERRLADVWARLDRVTDPELDEAVTDLGFLDEILITDDGVVDVAFKLPTYWCSPNFAFLMADDIRRSVSALAWVREVRPHLKDHMVAEEVNRGVQLGLSFGEAFSEFDAGETLDELRETFRRKAFERRQEVVLIEMGAIGYDATTLSRMTLAVFDGVDLGATAGARQKPRYRELLVERGLAARPDDLAFVTLDGDRIDPGRFGSYLRHLRAVRINMEFNGVLCRELLDARYKVAHVADNTNEDVRQIATGCGGECGGCAKKPLAQPST